MIQRLIALALVCLFAVVAPLALTAQEDASTPETDLTTPVATDTVLEDADEFERLAQRAEELAARDDASLFAISRLRAELVTWRDEFLSRSNINAGRLATVDAQIAALGPVPESGEEAPSVAERRAALAAQRSALMAPRLLAQEAYARANGLIGEFDDQALQQQTSELTVRGPLPLNPTHLAGAIAAVWTLFEVIGVEIAAGFSSKWDTGQLADALPRALVLFVVGIGLLGAGRRMVTRWHAKFAGQSTRWQPLIRVFLSIVQLLVPLIGLAILSASLEALDIFGLRGGDIVATIPMAGSLVIIGWWLSRLIFPIEDTAEYLGYDQATRARGRRWSAAIAWVMAIGALLGAGLRTMDVTEGAIAAFEWPFLVVLGLLLWRLGRVIATLPEQDEDGLASAGRLRRYIGSGATVVAVVAPTLATFGYTSAGTAMLGPSILSLALIGVLFLLQRIVHDMTLTSDNEEDLRGLYALLPVFVTFALFMLSLPLFALIWGAGVDDLTELWARFREGFAIGDSRISPTDFLVFAAVFAFGYVLTRFIQGTLRKSVMPRTRLDLGGQNAVVAGFGYVGIFLAALIAITSAGIDLSNLAIVAGALSVGIGFGLQNIVSNFVSGIILLIERPISEGDWIEVGGQMGYVRAISVRSTRIETFDRTDVIVPNADLVSGQVTNWTRGNLVGRVIVPVGVAYGTDVEKVTEILRGIAEAHPLVVMSPPPAVLFMGFGADSLDFEIRAILRDVNYVLVTKSEMNHAIAKEFAAAGIEIPFAQRDIWLRNPEVLKDQTPS
ncbi:DUF3772 domain-containing protein [Yoonia sp.]|uniref:DUF3772 domain-containing protein n=1 Tax=Yoonia sp. TaxID=2212373 RepID=UPI00358E60A8